MTTRFTRNPRTSGQSPWVAIVMTLTAIVMQVCPATSVVSELHRERRSSSLSLYQVDEFKSNGSVQLRHLVIDRRTNEVYIGAVNYIYSLDKDLNLRTTLQTGPVEDNIDCIKDTPCQSEMKPMDNLNKILLVDYDNRRLISCGTIFQGHCDRRDLSNISVGDVVPSYEAVVTYSPTASSLGYIARGPNGTDLYISTAHAKGSFYDPGAFARRNLKNFEITNDNKPSFTKSIFKIAYNVLSMFPVQYVYGFGSQNFSYMMSVQRKIWSERDMHSVIARVCQTDVNFYSYVETAIQCSQQNNENNLLLAATTSEVSPRLAKELGTDAKVDVLFAAFATGGFLPVERGARSVLCMYPMNSVRKTITDNIARCFNGTGKYGGDHFGLPKDCSVNTEVHIDDNYCGETDSNQPLFGHFPIRSQAVLTFPTSAGLVTSINVTTVNGFTVAFVGTDSGNLLKISLDSPTSAHVYETVPVSPDEPIQRDLIFDVPENHLYTLLPSKALKLKVADCTQYDTCETCVGAKDPYCGWCTLESKCSGLASCNDGELPRRWVPYNSQECPAIKSVQPMPIPTDKWTLLTLDVQMLVEFNTPRDYKCQFSSLDDPGFKPLTSKADRNDNKFQCNTPPVADLPKFAKTKDSVKMKLSIMMNDEELVYQEVTFFTCNVYDSCTPCTKSNFSCYWCVENHRCTDSAEKNCRNDDLITGMNSGSDSSNSNALQGHQYCPRFENSGNSQEILVAAGTHKSVKVIGRSLKTSQLDNLKCQFNFDEVIPVPALAKKTKTGPYGDTYEIICDGVDFNYVMGRKDSREVEFKILWGGADNLLDNPSGVKVVMYKCSIMASTCGDCLITPPKFQCGWCSTGASRCTTSDFCQVGSGGFLTKGSVCPNATVLKISPRSGPMEGGTLITIYGENLGSSESDIQVVIDTQITVNCDLVTFNAPKKIICRTKAGLRGQKGKVAVIISNQVKAESPQMFLFVTPKVLDISPSTGPVAGGTVITLVGEHLDAGSNVIIEIGQGNPCTQPLSLNSTALTCKTSPHSGVTSQPMGVYLKIDNTDLKKTIATFSYVQNPNITWVSRKSIIRSGGQRVNVSGQYLDRVQFPQMLIWFNGKAHSGPCNFTAGKQSTNMTCMTPTILNLAKQFNEVQELDFGFQMDGVANLEKLTSLGKMMVYVDPDLEPFEDGGKVHPQSHDILFLKGTNLDPVKEVDVKVFVGKAECVITSVISTVITCKPPPEQPAALVGSGPPEVMVKIGQNLMYNLGVLRYEQQDGLSMTMIIAIATVVGLVLIAIIAFVIFCAIRSRRNDDLMKKMRKEMDQLESRVANECKEAFAELQTNMSELTTEMAGGASIPFWDYRTYCMRVLFPGCNDHPVIRELEYNYRDREDIEQGLKLFFSLIKNKTFLLTFIRTLESKKDFTMKERVNVASLISVALQTQMEYATEILKVLLAELIEKNSSKCHPQLLLRRNESVAEKMLTNWFTFLLYKFLKECAGEPLFMLYGAIKQQVSNGPVDAVTGEARYSLSEDKLIRQQINFKPMVIHVMDIDVDRGQPAQTVKVLDCDTISQVKEKILDAIYKSAPFHSRPIKEELDLVSFEHSPEWSSIGDKTQISLKVFPTKDTKRLLLYDEDNSTKMDGNCKRINTLSHYQVLDGAFVALHPKQTSIYNMHMNSDKSYKYNDNSYSNHSPSLNRSVHNRSLISDSEASKVYHLVRDTEISNREGERGSKMVSEIYLPRLLVTKGTLQTYVDDLFERIFSTTSGGQVLPLAIKYMFDFLDDQAMLHNVSDEVVRNWKSNSLPLRFWVNVIKNPDFAFDIYKSNIVDACLTVIGQTFMDCCSNQENKLTKDSPSNKLLYAKDIPRYKNWVASYYEDIKIMPAISDQDMTAMLTEESRSHQNEFNTNAALLELYEYVKKYYDDIANALDEDEFAKKSKLSNKLEQVYTIMDGNLIC